MMALGAILMFLAPEEAWQGALLLAAGIVLELFGIVLEHKSK
jgi:hypothetical protein